MAKGWRRSWVKFWVNECLDGSIREELKPDERGIWYDLIMYSAKCRTPGIISANETQPISRRRLAGILNITEELLNTTIEKCVDSGRLRVDKAGLIQIVNWTKYQSESDRVRSYSKVKSDDHELASPTKLAISPSTVAISSTQKIITSKKQKYFFDNILLTEQEYQKLVGRFGEAGTKDRLEALSLYKKSQGKKYKDDYATVLAWERREQRMRGGQGEAYRGNAKRTGTKLPDRNTGYTEPPYDSRLDPKSPDFIGEDS